MSKNHLVIFDVDGTLVHSLEAEALLYPRACERALGLREISSDWESYRCPSDRGIVRELIEVNLGREAGEQDYLSVEQALLELVTDAYARQPQLSRPVEGAREAVSRFRRTSDMALSIATAGWHRTALHKLHVAELPVQDLPIATSHDAERKAEIMRVAADRAAERHGVEGFDSVVCFGDSRGDARAASELGYAFIGIDTSGFVADEEHTFADFGAIDEIMSTVRALQSTDRIRRLRQP